MSLLNVIEFSPSDPEACFEAVHTHVVNPGIGNYLEFPVATLRVTTGTEFQNLGDTLNRGCYGYVSFGYPSALIDFKVGQYLYYPPEYINYDHQAFVPPYQRAGYVCRVWVRKGVRLLINWGEHSPLETGAVLLLPGSPPQSFPDPTTGKLLIKGSSEVSVGGAVNLRGNMLIEIK